MISYNLFSYKHEEGKLCCTSTILSLSFIALWFICWPLALGDTIAVFRHELRKVSRQLGADVFSTNSCAELRCLQHLDSSVCPYQQKLSIVIVFPSWHLFHPEIFVLFQFFQFGVCLLETSSTYPLARFEFSQCIFTCAHSDNIQTLYKGVGWKEICVVTFSPCG